MGAEEVGRLAAVTLPGRERGDWERASCRRARVVGVEPREEEEEEEPPSSNPRTTASPGCGAPTPALYACRPQPPTASMIAAQLLAYYFTELKDDQVKKVSPARAAAGRPGGGVAFRHPLAAASILLRLAFPTLAVVEL